jgi:transmembrane sensor
MAETARLWVIRAGDPAFGDWDGFTAWLEANPAHLAAYEAALGVADWAENALAPAPRAANEDERPRPVPARRWLGWSGAIAACLALVGAWVVTDLSGHDEIVAPPGEHRTVWLADGSRAVLNGGTKLVLDEDSPRRVELAYGEALFEVHHDAADPFVVKVGTTSLVDAGTTFNVLGDGGALEVKVAQGAVIYRLGDREIRLDAGQGLTRAGADAEPVLLAASPATVGGWQDGVLQYDNAPLDRVARDLGRNLGLKIVAAQGAERMRFTGTLAINGTRAEVFARAGALMGVEFGQQGDGWRVTPTDDARR